MMNMEEDWYEVFEKSYNVCFLHIVGSFYTILW